MKKFFIVLLLIGTMLYAIPNIFAQETDKNEFKLEEIIITAERRTADVQKTAISISAIAGDEIEQKAYSTITNILEMVPGLEYGGHTSGGAITIRGIGSNFDAAVGDPAVALNVDGVVNTANMTLKGSMYDVKRVEVLRGPQGTLYGRNTTGGAINLVTEDPVHDFKMSGRLEVGNYNLLRTDGMINVPLGDKVAGRVVVSRTKRDGYYSNGNMDADTWSARLKILAEPTDKISVVATLDHQVDKSSGTATVPLKDTVLGGTKVVDVYDPDDPWYSSYPKGWMDNKTDSYKLQVDWDLGFGTLTMLPALTKISKIGQFAVVSPGQISETAKMREQEQYTMETRLASPSESKMIWVLGLYGVDAKYKDNMQDGSSTVADDEFNMITYSRPVKSYAGFGQATYPFTDRFRLTGGLRYTVDSKKNTIRITRVSPAYDSGIINWEKKYGETTYKLGVEYDVAKDSMLYLQTSTGYKAGGFANTIPPAEYDPEYLIAYALGSKNRFLNNRLQVNAEAYYYRYDNYQINVSSGTFKAKVAGEWSEFTGFTIMNAGASTNYGLEVESQYLITSNDKLGLNVALMRTKLGDFIIPGQTYTDEDTGTTTVVSVEEDLTGRPMANSPEWTASLSYGHDWYLNNGGTISASSDIRLSSGYYVTLEQNLYGAWQERYQKYDAYLTYVTPSGKWSINTFGKNLSKEAVKTYIMPLGRAVMGEPRTYGIALSVKY